MLENILGELNGFKITIEDLNRFCLKPNNKITIGNSKCYENIYLSSFNHYINYVKKIKIKKDGIYLDYDPILNRFKNIFGLSSLDIETVLRKKEDYRNINSIDDIKCIGDAFYQEFNAFFPAYEEKGILPKNKINEFRNRMMRNLDKLLEYRFNDYLNYAKLNDNIINIIDLEKLELYINYTIIKYIKTNEVNEELKQKCINVLTNYINNEKNSEIVISKINKDTIKNEFNKLNIKKEDKKEEKEKFNFFEVDKEYDEMDTNGKKFTKYSSHIEKEKREIQLLRKINFYNGLDIIKKHIGANSYSGYVGYELNTGKVILDKLYDGPKGCEINAIAYGEAIYIVKVEDLAILNRESKSEIIRKIYNKELDAKRILHSNNWEDRVKNAIKK